MPEAALAREIGLCYAAIVVVVNHAAGRGTSTQGIRLQDAEAIAKRSMARVLRILDRLAVSNGD
jgi:5'-methylthioadenosine phosphorylase